MGSIMFAAAALVKLMRKFLRFNASPRSKKHGPSRASNLKRRLKRRQVDFYNEFEGSDIQIRQTFITQTEAVAKLNIFSTWDSYMCYECNWIPQRNNWFGCPQVRSIRVVFQTCILKFERLIFPEWQMLKFPRGRPWRVIRFTMCAVALLEVWSRGAKLSRRRTIGHRLCMQ